MEFPISRERLLNIRKEIDDMLKKKAIDKLVEQYTNEIIESATTGREHILRLLQTCVCNVMEAFPKRVPYRNKVVYLSKDEQIQVINENLKSKFPDCEFILDPLQTYVLVRW